MSIKVKLRALAEAMDAQMDEDSVYLDLRTGETIEVPNEDLGQVEDGEMPKICDDVDLLRDIIDHPEIYLELPSKYDIHEYSIIEDFCRTRTGRLRDELLSAIHGRGAFRRFKEAISRHGVEGQWHAFKEEALKEMAREWCEENGVEYEDEAANENRT